MRLRHAVPLLATAALVVAPAAAAHVTMNPDSVPADSFARFAIRVPNERDNASTTKLVVKLPKGLVFVSFEPKPGWKRSVTTEKLERPVTVEGDKLIEQVATVTWHGGKIGPGEFDEFGMSAKMPNSPGRTLVFPAVQTYSNGEVVRWIAPQDADEPAPHVKLEAAEPETPSAETTTTSSESEEGDDDDRTNLALGFGIAGVVLGLAGLGAGLWRRRV